MRTLIPVLVLAATACASGPTPAETYDPLVGHATKDEIVERFGVPSRQVALDDREIWVYRQTDGTYSSNGIYHFTPCALVTLTFDSRGVLAEWKHEEHTDCPS